MRKRVILFVIATFVFYFATSGYALAAPTVTLSTTASSISENGGVAGVNATLSAISTETITVTLGKRGTATDPDDYLLGTTTITILPGRQKGVLFLTAVDDAIDEPNETVIFSITAVSGGGATVFAQQEKTITITDNDPTPNLTLSVNPTNITELGGVATLTATIDAVSGQTVTVNLARSGTASTTQGVDYTLSEEAITIPAGQVEGSIALTSVDDSLFEPSETVVVTISTLKNANESRQQQQTIHIIDDDVSPGITIEVDNATISEKGGVAIVTARRDVASAKPVTIKLSRTGTAKRFDYKLSSILITIPAGSLFGSVVVNALDDHVYELDETVILAISRVNPSEAYSNKEVTITIQDDDPQPIVTLRTKSSIISERGGSTYVEAILSALTSLRIIVNLVTEGTASSTDFTWIGTPRIVIPPLRKSGSARLKAIDDSIYEGNETILVSLADIINAVGSSTPVITTIRDDESTPKVTLSAEKKELNEGGEKTMVRVQLSGKLAFDTTVTLGLGGTATEGEDYRVGPKTLTIPSGSMGAETELITVDDVIHEGEETIIVEIESAGPNAVESGIQKQLITIKENDPVPTVTLSVDPIIDIEPFRSEIEPVDPSAIPEQGGVAILRATTKPRSTKEIKVTLGIDRRSSATSTDYILSNTTIVIPPESESGSVTLTAVDDTLYERDETILIEVTGVINGSENGTQTQTVTIIDDDSPPNVTLSVGNTTIAEKSGTTTVTATLSTVSGIDVSVTLGVNPISTATSTDYTLSGTSITIPKGGVSASVTLSAVNDSLNELDETVIIDVDEVKNGTEEGVQQQTVTILDEDYTLTVIKDGSGTGTVISTTDGIDCGVICSASFATNTAVILTATPEAGSIFVSWNGDCTGTGTCVVTLTATTTITATFTLQPSVFWLVGSQTSLGESGLMSVTAQLSGVSELDVTVPFTVSGTATSDYTITASPITILAGSTTGTATITIITDTAYEADETVVLTMGGPTNANLGTTTVHTATITDDDPTPTVFWTASSQASANESGTMSVTAQLSAVSGKDVTVPFTVSGTATSTVDYSITSSPIMILAGSTMGTSTITITADTLGEPNETVVLTMGTPTNATQGTTTVHTATITDDDETSATDSWSAISTTNAPSARSGHTAVWTGSKMLIWGGYDMSGPLNTGGVYDPVNNSWSGITTTNAPAARGDHTAVWTGSKMLVWGGSNSVSHLNTGGVYDLATDSWTTISTTNAPTARQNHGAVWTGSKMLIWGGNENAGSFNTGGAYDPATNSWSAINTTNAPTERTNHTVVWTGFKMLVWGGKDSAINLNTGGVYDPTTNSWSAMTTTNAPTARQFARAVWTGSKMLVWGGSSTNNSGFFNTGGVYDPATNSWSDIITANAPTAKRHHTAVWTGFKMLIWGGFDGSSLNTGGGYDPETHNWSAITTTNAPTGRSSHTAVWTESRMLIWGGYDANYLNTGGVYDPETDITVTIPATSSWVNSGVTLSGGELIQITATASWRADPAQPLNDAWGRAEPCNTASPTCPIHASHSALVGRVGNNPPFFVGRGFTFPNNPGWSGPLQFMINDDLNILGDNTGSATVTVFSPPSTPTPPSTGSVVTIPATSSWVSSGIALSGGELVQITATASWQGDPAQPLNDAWGRAEPCNTASPTCPIHASHSALVGRVGNNPPFFVGREFTFPNNLGWSGSLQFMINDDLNILGDNTGSATISVRVQ